MHEATGEQEKITLLNRLKEILETIEGCAGGASPETKSGTMTLI
jgi:hypothetical protein